MSHPWIADLALSLLVDNGDGARFEEDAIVALRRALGTERDEESLQASADDLDDLAAVLSEDQGAPEPAGDLRSLAGEARRMSRFVAAWRVVDRLEPAAPRRLCCEPRPPRRAPAVFESLPQGSIKPALVTGRIWV
jgi:hypothetical protein